jgi:acetyl esterase
MTTAVQAPNVDPAEDPAIDRRTRAFLEELNKDSSPFWELPGDEPRNIVTALQNETPVDLSGVETDTHQIAVEGRNINLHVVRPEGVSGALPTFMFFHGAVWIAGNFENHKRLVRDLVVGSRAAAVFVEYTPVPEARYPVQINQAYESTLWVTDHGHEIGLDSGRLAVSGNSVGGNMAAAVTLMVHDKGGANLVYQQLLWPALDTNLDTGSYRAFGEGRFLPTAFMRYGWDHYAPDAETRRHRYAAPLQATVEQLRGLPATLIQTAENDVLRDEGEAYARKLADAGVPVELRRFPDQIHGFLNAIGAGRTSRAAVGEIAAKLRAALT